MRTDILRDLANRLESGEVPAETFDMKHYVLVEGAEDEDRSDESIAATTRSWCGTTACVAGHLALRYGNDRQIRDLQIGTASIKRVAMEVVGVDFYDTANGERYALTQLFNGPWSTVPGDVWDATPQMAARELRDLADRADRGELE